MLTALVFLNDEVLEMRPGYFLRPRAFGHFQRLVEALRVIGALCVQEVTQLEPELERIIEFSIEREIERRSIDRTPRKLLELYFDDFLDFGREYPDFNEVIRRSIYFRLS